MIRRVHVRSLQIGSINLGADEAHHIRDVLRLTVGADIELFDSVGNSAAGKLTAVNASVVTVNISTIESEPVTGMQLTVASAVPKGDRAEWMIEKLSELGVHRFIPLAAQRSVVLPAGRNKIERWERIAIEAAKQSRRAGVMIIDELTSLENAIRDVESGWYLSTAPDAMPVTKLRHSAIKNLTLLIGPEGGWTDAELHQFQTAELIGVGLTNTILRIETAAITAAAVAMCLSDPT